MPRIRTIKPEFPQSESMGRISRDARLLYILLWTQADDAGKLRGNSRILASLLFPYDDDALSSIDRWLDELENEGCIVRYFVEKSTYLQIIKWSEHQRIDHPTPSKIPDYSREFARIRENNGNPRAGSKDLDQGSRIKDQGSGSGPKEGNGIRERSRFQKPTIEEVRTYCDERCNQIDPEAFVDYYSSNGWKVGRSMMKDWKAAVRTWEKRQISEKSDPVAEWLRQREAQ